MKPKGAWEVRRTIKLPALTQGADVGQLEGRLADVPGVRQVRAESARGRVQVLYDIRVCDYKVLEQALEDAGLVPLDNWWARLLSN